MKKFLFAVVVTCLTLPGRGQTALQSPDQFLGYPLGSKFTPHHRVVAYAEQVARQLPKQVKLMPYGQSF